MSVNKAEAPREHGHHAESHAGSPITNQMRTVGQRRRDAEEKLEHHLEEARHQATAKQDDVGSDQ
ncbi:hypothetical protein AB4Y67_17555 [Arthrobacter sp. YAF17]|uniref:hypothetical protein n=1 Tax=Arthrobacter sp. YAF17 TaxID=3233077 RepID=UPI003F8F7BE4